MIPDHQHPGSLVVGEVFHDSIGPRQQHNQQQNQPRQQQQQYYQQQHSFKGYSFPRPGGPPLHHQYAVQGGEPLRGTGFQNRSPHTVEIQVGPGTGGFGEQELPSTAYGRPDIEIQPVTGYAKPELDVRPHSFGARPDIEISMNHYERPSSEHKNLVHYVDSKPGKEQPGKASIQSEFGKPYDTGNSLDYPGLPDVKSKRPHYEGYENMKNLIKPSKVINCQSLFLIHSKSSVVSLIKDLLIAKRC